MSIDSKVICNVCGWSGNEDKVSTVSGLAACPKCYEVDALDFNDVFEAEPTEEELAEELEISEKESNDISLESLKNDICEDYIENMDYDEEVLCNTCGWIGSSEELDREGMSPACPNCYEDEDLSDTSSF